MCSEKKALHRQGCVHLKIKGFGECSFLYFACIVFFLKTHHFWSRIEYLRSNNCRKVMILMKQNKTN